MSRTRPYDPFNPEVRGSLCPSCKASKLSSEEEGVRKCRKCGRVERWVKPSRKELGERRYKRLVARQRKKFGALGTILFQWVAEPEPETEPPGTDKA